MERISGLGEDSVSVSSRSPTGGDQLGVTTLWGPQEPGKDALWGYVQSLEWEEGFVPSPHPHLVQWRRVGRCLSAEGHDFLQREGSAGVIVTGVGLRGRSTAPAPGQGWSEQEQSQSRSRGWSKEMWRGGGAVPAHVGLLFAFKGVKILE